MTHVPVMLDEVLTCLNPMPQETYVDATFGRGGYAQAILDRAPCRVMAFDRDPDAIKASASLVTSYTDRLTVIEAPFSHMDDFITTPVQGVVFDLGVSSPQLDTPGRGFSFKAEGPLDMRMSQSGESAADVVNTYSERDIADILCTYGEEPKSRAIARRIVERRKETPFLTTTALAELARSFYKGYSKTDPATRTFQALRIHVNDELGQLKKGLEVARNLLEDGGRLVVVTFHSLEDRIVKNFMKQHGGGDGAGSRHMPQVAALLPTLRMGARKAIQPTEEAIAANPRARSAKLRWAIKMNTNNEGRP